MGIMFLCGTVISWLNNMRGYGLAKQSIQEPGLIIDLIFCMHRSKSTQGDLLCMGGNYTNICVYGIMARADWSGFEPSGHGAGAG
jgi:hypothetical protein